MSRSTRVPPPAKGVGLGMLDHHARRTVRIQQGRCDSRRFAEVDRGHRRANVARFHLRRRTHEKRQRGKLRAVDRVEAHPLFSLLRRGRASGDARVFAALRDGRGRGPR